MFHTLGCMSRVFIRGEPVQTMLQKCLSSVFSPESLSSCCYCSCLGLCSVPEIISDIEYALLFKLPYSLFPPKWSQFWFQTIFSSTVNQLRTSCFMSHVITSVMFRLVCLFQPLFCFFVVPQVFFFFLAL